MFERSKIYSSFPPDQFHSYATEIMRAIERVCNFGPYILGPEVEAFEKEFADYNGAKYCVGVGSGTDALILSMRALDIGPGDEVITVSHTAVATVSAIIAVGAIPVLVDIEDPYYTMDPNELEAAITGKTKAIIPVHLYGQPCDMDSIKQVADRHNLYIIEDCAQAHGAVYKGKKVGTIGDIGCFSFYPTKNLGAIGDGGGVITDNNSVYERIKRLRQYGWDSEKLCQEPGIVSRLDELQAAILRVKLKYLDEDSGKRRDIAELYDKCLVSTGWVLPTIRSSCIHAYHLYVVRASNRDEVKAKLKTKGIEVGIHYQYPAHKHPGVSCKARIAGKLKITEIAAEQIFSLPIYPELFVKENILKEVIQCLMDCTIVKN